MSVSSSRVDEQLGTGELNPIPTKNKKLEPKNYIIFPSERKKAMPFETNASMQDLKQSLASLPYVSVQVLSMKKEAPSFRVG